MRFAYPRTHVTDWRRNRWEPAIYYELLTVFVGCLSHRHGICSCPSCSLVHSRPRTTIRRSAGFTVSMTYQDKAYQALCTAVIDLPLPSPATGGSKIRVYCTSTHSESWRIVLVVVSSIHISHISHIPISPDILKRLPIADSSTATVTFTHASQSQS